MKAHLTKLLTHVQQMIKDKEYEVFLTERAMDKKREELAFVKGALDGLTTLNAMDTSDGNSNTTKQQESEAS